MSIEDLPQRGYSIEKAPCSSSSSLLAMPEHKRSRSLDPGVPPRGSFRSYSSSGVISPVLDNILAIDVKEDGRAQIYRQWPQNGQIQADAVVQTLIPPQIAKFRTKIHSSTVPIHLDPRSGHLSCSGHRGWIYSLSVCLANPNDAKIVRTKALAVVLRWPIFEALKPLLTFVLHQLFENDQVPLPELFDSLNCSRINELLAFYTGLNSQERLIMASTGKWPSMPPTLKSVFLEKDGLIKSTVRFQGIPFPIHFSKKSLTVSSACMFGFNLDRDNHLRLIFQKLMNLRIMNFSECDLSPYKDINSVHIFLNALLLKKRIVVYGNESQHDEVNTFIELMSTLLDNPDEGTVIFPSLHFSMLSQLNDKHSYIVGITNSTLKNKISWDVYLNFDLNFIDTKSAISNSYVQIFDDPTKDSQFNELINMDPTYWDPNSFPNLGEVNYNPPRHIGELNMNLVTVRAPAGTFGKPFVDSQFDEKLSLLLNKKHDDLTIYLTVVNYFKLLKSLAKSFHHFHTVMLINDFQVYLKEVVLDEDQHTGLEMFISYHNLVQSMPLVYGYQKSKIPLPDTRILEYYSKLVLPNFQLLQLVQNMEMSTDLTFNWEGVNLELDLQYLLHVIDTTLNYNDLDWSIPKSILLQIFKVLNQSVKYYDTISHFFIDQNINYEFDDNEAAFDKLNVSMYNRELISAIGDTKKAPSNGIKRFSNLILVASLYINTDGPEDIVETSKGLRKKDLVSSEFKQFISNVLNNELIRSVILTEVDDFVKLIINDLIESYS